MLKKTITYTDYNGFERTEDFWFNLSKAELIEMELSKSGGLSESLKRIVNSKDTPSIIREFKYILSKSYGIKSDDGRRFIKSKEISDEFMQTEAYTILFMELATNTEAATLFINKLIPSEKVMSIADESILPSQNEKAMSSANEYIPSLQK